MERYRMEIVNPGHGNQHTTMKKDSEGGRVKLKGNVMTASNVEVRGLNQIYLELYLKGKSVGFMRITDKVEFSIDGKIWVGHDEGICTCGMALQWDGAVVISGLPMDTEKHL